MPSKIFVAFNKTSMIQVQVKFIVIFINLLKALHLWLCIYHFKSVTHVACN